MDNKFMLRLYFMIILLFFITFTPHHARAAEIDLQNQWPAGPANAIAVYDSAIFVGHGAFITVFHTGNFQQISQYKGSGYIRSITIAGHYAYISATDAGLLILDISNPASLHKVAEIKDIVALKTVVQGNYAYIAALGDGLRILDISNPANPQILIDFKPENWIADVAVSGNYAFLSCYSAGLCIVDIQNPASPAKVSTYAAGFSTPHVGAAGSTVFICGDNDVQVVDFTNINQPQAVTTLEGQVLDIAINANIAYLVNDTHYCVDMHDLTDPAVKKIGSCGDMYASAVAVQNGIAYVTRDSFGFKAYNVSDPTKPASYGKWVSDKTLEEPFIVGDYMAFPVYGEGKLRFYNVQDILHPQLVSEAELRIDDYIYVAPYLYYTDGNKLRTCNLGDINNPVEENKTTLNIPSAFLFRQGDTLITYNDMANTKGFTMYSLADPKKPVKLATVTTELGVSVLGKKGNVVYLKSRQDLGYSAGSLYCLDISNPAAPQKGGVMIPEEIALLFGVHNNYGMAKTDDDSVIVFDLSQPLQPVRVSSFVNSTFSIPTFIGNLAYCAGSGITVYDVTDMTNWRKISEFSRNDYYLGTLYYPPYFIKPTLDGSVYVFDISAVTRGTLLGEVSFFSIIDRIEADGNNLYLLDANATLTRLVNDHGALTVNGSQTFKEFGTQYLAGLQIDGATGYVAEEYYGHLHKIDLASENLDILNTWYIDNFQISAFVVNEPYLYLRKSDEFRIYDISSPSRAVLLGAFTGLNSAASRFIIRWPYAYLVDWRTLRILNISDPANPQQVATYTDDVSIDDMALSGDYIYLGNRYSTVKIRALNISNPAAPVAAGMYNDRIYGASLAADGEYLYVGGGMYGLNILNFSDPQTPTLATSYLVNDIDLSDVAVAGNQIYVLDRYRGVLLFKNNLLSSINDQNTGRPLSCQLLPNYPNPFNAGTTISFTLPREERVTVTIYNLLGQAVATLVDKKIAAGNHTFNWQATAMPSGLYFCEFKAGAFKQTRRMLLLK
ncbi:MAG TPA: T9SS type A sorting domain-containing protein [bacterium]|nr:T9SS type A sorting domain-containing protein [bacterium]HPN44597.1 T9SS type A sorting domain-containing protein [bacterium]